MIPKEVSYQEYIHRLFPELCDNGNKPIRTVTMQVTEACNLNCSYCYQHAKTNNKLSYETAVEFVDMLLSNKIPYVNITNTTGIIFDFIGGEPFLEIDLIAKISEYIKHQMVLLNHPWKNFYRFSFSSNGTLHFDPRVQQYLHDNSGLASVTVSLDGNKDLHDACRVFHDGSGSYDIACSAAKHLIEYYHATPTTKMTIAPENVKYIYDATVNLIELGYAFINLNCVYENVWSLQDARVLYKELTRVSDYLFDHNLHDEIYFKMLSDDIGTPLSEDDNDNYCGGTGKMLALDWRGNVYPCLRYMPSSIGCNREPYTIGKIEHGNFVVTEEHCNRVNCLECVTRRSQSTDECFNCPIASGCGWCSAYNYECYGTVNKRSTGICIMHKARCLAAYEFWVRYNKVMGIDEEITCNLKPEWIAEIKGE